jgi:hypothetical protein
MTNKQSATWIKTPIARLDYTFVWDNWLVEGDSIKTSQVMIEPSGELIVSQVAIIGNSVQVWLTGGLPHKRYKVLCTIETANKRIDEKVETLLCKPK